MTLADYEDHLDWQANIADAKRRLAQLSVKELRVLARHYRVGGDTKTDLVVELTDLIVDDEKL